MRGSPNDARSTGQADLSSTQQFHFPSALPPSISHPLSSGLNSAFTYNGINNHIIGRQFIMWV